ncbi:hypothetical protein [Polyangium sp. 15x6]|uniref:hypothetical protein n=1 Tax=Polyangium sp. 15x6 TaxID=3042687 RepID=UPI00249C7F0D|nr:hypothetical protein [Polyangium sp. 15x6]MDI3282990.1 hypothetical protein [Polyangium sp. 15x6]
MPKPDPRVLARTAGNYLKEHPEEIVRALRSALGLRASIPMDALRYLAREFVPDNKKAPKDIVIEAAPPGVRVAATVDAMGTPLRASLILHIEEIDISLTEMRIGVRIEGLTLTVLGDSSSPLAGLLKSGALDLSKPGNLVAFMPKRPPMLVEAKDDRLTLDLMKVPKLAENPKVRRYLSIALPVASVRAIRTKDDHLDVHLKANLGGLPQAIAAARQTV